MPEIEVPEDAPKPKRKLAAAVAEQMAMAHGPVNGAHAHPHSSFDKATGASASHDHLHMHGDGKASHQHDHRQSIPGMSVTSSGTLPFGLMSFAADDGEYALPAELADADGVMVNGSLTASAMVRLGSPFGIEGSDESGWRVLAADADGAITAASWDTTATTYQEALGIVAQQLATQGPRPVLAQAWRSDMAFENVSTGDGRRIAPGGIQYRDCPLPLMLQVVTAPGHMGAVLAGSIEQCGTVGGTAIGTGSFDDSDAGRQFAQIIEARGKFGVSIDVAEAEGEFECTETDDEGDCIDGEMCFSMVRVMGETGTPFPAFSDAYIEIAANAKPAVAASGADPDGEVDVEPCADCEQESSEPLVSVQVSAAPTFSVVASGGPARPPRPWFEDPLFEPGDGRMVRQPDGQYLCPLTVTADGRVYGHFAGWRTCHTGYQACVTAPRSRTNYAAFNMRPLECDDGELVNVGPIAMGCGHIDDDGTPSVAVVKAFYDGGPGAVCAALVHAGEDRYGGWFAGCLAEGLSDRQARKFARLSVSGHWKEVWRGKGLDLVACAAGVFSPGFTVTRTLAAAGFVPDFGDDTVLLPEPKVSFRDGRPVALVAAGVVRRPMPWEVAQADLAQQVDELRHELRAQRAIVDPLMGLAAERLVASMEPV